MANKDNKDNTNNAIKETQKEFKNTQNITKIEDFGLNNMDLYRGDTPTDINDQCLQLCKDYLSGEWIQQTVDTITIKRITGGLTNQLYYCGINEPNPTSKVPQEVVIRFYGKKHIKNSSDNYERLSDVIIDLMVSENQLGPKVYAIFEHGQIIKYYKHRQFKIAEQSNPKLVDEVFRKLARIHAMDVPIKRTNTRLDRIDEWYRFAFEGNFDIKAIFEANNCQTLLNADIKSEIDFIKDVIVKADSPIVFNHCDYRSSNLLVTESADKTDGPIVVCDFEYGSYGFRGFDFKSLIQEWGRKPFDYSVDGLPLEDSVLRPLVEIYVNECEKIFGKQFTANEINSVDHIINEINLLHLFSLLFLTIFFIKMDLEDKSDIKTNPFLFAETFLKNYLVLKQRYQELNLV
ncbi:choline kinase A2-like [Oppia nitens]|uniref:choline kinase A2-like n=1 Tax=Oppia nitens TaxID=1686743 RepID=UPI0023DA25E3|nr:choline kinase A2-like [Oppia nitens]